MVDPRVEKLAKILIDYSCDVQKGEKISEILKKEIENNKYEVVGCKFNNE